MTVRLDGGADLATARWLCHGCGARYGRGGPAYPVCEICGQRCRALDADGLPFVGSPDDRVEAAHAAHARAYDNWLTWLRELRERLDALRPATPADIERWAAWPGWVPAPEHAWAALIGATAYANWTAEHVDRVEVDVARLNKEIAR